MTCAWNRTILALALIATTASANVPEQKPLDAEHSVVLAAAPEKPGHFVLYIVSSATNQKLLTLDPDAQGTISSTPTLEVLPGGAVYLHFFGDYGFYGGSIKYVYDLTSTAPPGKIPYPRIALTAAAHEQGKLRYWASDGPRNATIFIDPHDAALPSYRFFVDDAFNPEPVPVSLHGPGGEFVRVENTPLGQAHRPAAIAIGSGATENRFPVPIPTLDLYHRTLPEKQSPGEIESDIGPYEQRGDRIWFASTFYDSEGTSGIGAIGSFDISSRHYEMRYLPAIASWSGSAILLDNHDLWIGLKRRPEGAEISGGLLRYNIATGAVKTYPIPDVIFTISRAGDALYCGTSHGLYMLRADRLTQLRFEPDATGKLTMIPRPIGK